jgi:hypothetical protein
MDDYFAACLIYDLEGLAMRHDLVSVVRQELIQICRRILQIGRLVLLSLIVVNSCAIEVSWIEGAQNDHFER